MGSLRIEKVLYSGTNYYFESDYFTQNLILIEGDNGTGKTTTIGKLTKHLSDNSQSVLIAAGDTFRAAAVEQLQVWGARNNVTVISQETGDPSAVIFDAINSARSKKIDVAIADTAGRLPTQKHLLDEITKIKKVMSKCHEGSPHEVLLVIDANTGQNAINQLKVFSTEGEFQQEIYMPEDYGTVGDFDGDSSQLYFAFESFISPQGI